MCTKATLDELLKRFRKEAEKLFGDKLEEMILYGSYARGDNTEESDIDVMIIADIPMSEEIKCTGSLTNTVVDFDLEYDVVLSVIVESKEKYEKYKTINPLFVNVEKEGIKIAA